MNIKDIARVALLTTASINLISMPARAADPDSSPPNAKIKSTDSAVVSHEKSLSVPEQKFMQKSTLTNLLEIEIGKLAQKKAQTSQVRAFADRMVKDHSDAQRSLQTVAQATGIVLPKNLGPSEQKVFDKLNKLQGQAFDTAYIAFNLPAHAETLATMKKEEPLIKNSKLLDWTAKTIPTVQSHLVLARQTDKELASLKQKATAGGKPSHL